MAKNKVFIGTIAAAGIVVLLVIGYKMGQRQAQAPMPAGAPMMQGAPNTGSGTGPGHRKQQMAQSGQDESRGRRSSGDSGNGSRGGKNSGRSMRIQEGTLGSEKITVIAAGKETSFTGADLKDLKPTTVATTRGARKGWPAQEVMKHLGITKAKELVFVDKEGKTLNLSWEAVTNHEPMVILTYNRMGGLMLVSGGEMTAEKLQTAENRDVKKTASEDKNRLFLSNIVKIEVKT